METYAQSVIRQSGSPTCGHEVCDFMEQIGPTLMGVKPACILSIRAAECLEVCKKHFLKDSPLAFVIIRDASGGKQMFLYHRERLNEVLHDKRVKRYLSRGRDTFLGRGVTIIVFSAPSSRRTLPPALHETELPEDAVYARSGSSV